jgi:hypothetical protein
VVGADEAVQALRHVVQEHGDEHTVIGRPAHLPGILWFGQLLGWRWPSTYLQVLEKHDGVLVQDAILFSFLESVENFLTVHHSRWHRPDGYWPVGSDGCGNYYALAFAEQDESGECPVVFFEMIQSATHPRERVAATYADFVCQHMTAQCRYVNCHDGRIRGS